MLQSVLQKQMNRHFAYNCMYGSINVNSQHVTVVFSYKRDCSVTKLNVTVGSCIFIVKATAIIYALTHEVK